MVFQWFFVPFWVFGINLDSLNKVFNMSLSLTNENIGNDMKTLIVFILLGSLLTIYQGWCILKLNGGEFRNVVAYLLSVASFMTPFIVIGKQIHVHHYLFALFTMPMIYGNSFVTLMLWGTMVGVFVNGIAVWGPDPLFY
jgi:hypothetical protein